jgi:NFU1 iron-sulfur cluster scaffold homolog, mitochondrial
VYLPNLAGSMRSLHVDVEGTPNANSLKFIVDGETILGPSHGTGVHFATVGDAAEHSPLAARLFHSASQVEAVYLAPAFITVTKREDAVWDDLQPEILRAIEDAFESSEPLVKSAPEDVEEAAVEVGEVVIRANTPPSFFKHPVVFRHLISGR